MLETAVGQKRPVWFVRGARGGKERALRDETYELVAQSRHTEKRVYYSQPG